EENSHQVLCAAFASSLGYTDEEFEADKLRVNELISSSQDDISKINNTQELIDIYKRPYSRLTLEDREAIDKIVNKHTDEILVDGVPSQGGRKTKYAKKILTPAAQALATGFFEEMGASIANIFSG
ncbi:hypothetical protein KR084_009222, partial [Drosophila pseudotakahashii]